MKQAIKLLSIALVVSLAFLVPARADVGPMTSDEYAAWLTVTSEQLFGAGEHFNDDKWLLDSAAIAENVPYSGHTAVGIPFLLTASDVIEVVRGPDYQGCHVTHRFLTAQITTSLDIVFLDVLGTSFENIVTGVVTDTLLPIGYAGTLVGGGVAGFSAEGAKMAELEPAPGQEPKDPCQACKNAYNSAVAAAKKQLKKDLRDCALWCFGGPIGCLAGALCAGFAAGDAADDISAAVDTYCACMAAGDCELPPTGPPCDD